MFWRLTTVADDHGRFEADPRVLLAQCFPLRVERMKAKQAAVWLEEMVACGLVRVYTVGGKPYGHFPTWPKHQRVRARESKYPAPPELPSSADICQQMSPSADIGGQPLANAPEGMGYGIEGKGDGGEEARGALLPLPLLSSTNGAQEPEPHEAAARASAVICQQERANGSGSVPSWPSPETLADLYNATVPAGHPKVTTPLTKARTENARRCLKQFPDRGFWEAAYA